MPPNLPDNIANYLHINMPKLTPIPALTSDANAINIQSIMGLKLKQVQTANDEILEDENQRPIKYHIYSNGFYAFAYQAPSLYQTHIDIIAKHAMGLYKIRKLQGWNLTPGRIVKLPDSYHIEFAPPKTKLTDIDILRDYDKERMILYKTLLDLEEIMLLKHNLSILPEPLPTAFNSWLVAAHEHIVQINYRRITRNRLISCSKWMRQYKVSQFQKRFYLVSILVKYLTQNVVRNANLTGTKFAVQAEQIT